MALPQVYFYIFSVYLSCAIKITLHCLLSENNKEITIIKNVLPWLEYKYAQVKLIQLNGRVWRISTAVKRLQTTKRGNEHFLRDLTFICSQDC